MKKWFAASLALLFVLLTALPAGAAPYRTYTYVNASDGVYAVDAPAAYIPGETFDARRLGVTLEQPEDLYCDENGCFYIADKGGSAVYAFDRDWHLRYTVATFDNGGEEDSLSGPEGLCVDSAGRLWIADTENSRLLCFDQNGRLQKELGTPVSPLLGDEFSFFPSKLVVDEVDRIFVVCRNVYDGLVQLTVDGQFVGFVGSNFATSNWYEQFWQSIMTEEQRQKRLAFIAMEYANIALDRSGFLYVVTAVSDVTDPIRRLNPSGGDVLIRNAVNGIKSVCGDLVTGDGILKSSIVDIAEGDTGIYYALDAARGRVFAYDEDGNMLFVFGGINTYQQGTFLQPCSLVIRDEVVYVLDRDAGSVTAFTPTAYAETIYRAVRSYRQSDYENSLLLWEDLLQKNGNFDLAYDKAGLALYRMGQYRQAMDRFSAANDRENYSLAMNKYRKEWIDEHFTLCAAATGGLIVLIAAARLIARRRKSRGERSNGNG